MKKKDKIDVLNQALENNVIATCYFTYYRCHMHYYVGDVNDKFLYGIEEDDFSLDGYEIRKLSKLKKVYIRDDKTDEINELLGTKNDIYYPNIKLNSWKDIFNNDFLKDELRQFSNVLIYHY